MAYDSPLHVITCSMLTIETLRKTYEIFTKLTIKTAEIVCPCRISRSDKKCGISKGCSTTSQNFKGKVTYLETPEAFFKYVPNNSRVFLKKDVLNSLPPLVFLWKPIMKKKFHWHVPVVFVH